jgi:ABC-type lipoprotein export system ATPase subunit
VSAVEVRDVFLVHSTDEGEAAALQGLSLTVEPGELLVVFGPSGSGKTTLLRALAGYVRPSTGRIEVFGRDVTRMSERKLSAYRTATIGYLDQHYWRVLSPEITALEMVGLQLSLRGARTDHWRTRAAELLASVGLSDKASAHVDALSGGEQQRVALCTALAHRPQLLLADEPTGELDAETAARVYDLTRELTKSLGCTTVVVTHDDRWRPVADRVVRIRDGRVTEEITESHPGRELLVVDARGWVRLPDSVRARARVGGRVQVDATDDGVVLRAVDGHEPVARAQHAALRSSGPGGAAPADVVLGDVGKRYGEGPVLRDVTALFHAGTFNVVTGRSGSGKTTLLRLIAGLELPDQGDISIAGRVVSSLAEAARAELRRRDLAYVSQQSLLAEHLTARENVEVGLGIRGLGDPEAAERALDLVGLGTRAEHRLRRLSTGERARVALARGLASGARVLVLDEPTSRLDEENARFVGVLLARMARDFNVCVICATHDPEVIAIADQELPLR